MRAHPGCARLLAELIGFPTDNPRGDELALCEHLARLLEERGADRVDVARVPRPAGGEGGFVYARFGAPRLLLNAHIDTVPANTGWTRDPFRAEILADRVVGLGAADTKGAIAAILTALDAGAPRDVGILFSGDEERGTACMRAFVASEHRAGIERALVCEPTARRAGVTHRGVRCYRIAIRGQGGHSSRADHMPRPIVAAARLAVALDELGRRRLDDGPEEMKGICMNVASVEGGVAFNVVPDAAALTFSIRPPPGFDQAGFDRELETLLPGAGEPAELSSALAHEPFSCRDPAWFRVLLAGRVADLVPLDFWTEAAVLSAAGVDAVVVGPGDIAQAHAADEFVTLDDLAWAEDLFRHVFEQSRRAPA